mgnify:FL=1
MKQENNENRPSFGLMKLNNIISYYHMQMPRWLFSDSGYSDMTLESKVAYTFLLNRFQLSRRNGWVNRYGEVYVIYTREDLAGEMQISYRKAISCFKELTEKHLVWEQRQGRGLPNRIFLAEVVFAEKAAFSYDCAPFSANENRPAENAGLENEDDMDSNKENCSEMPDTDAEPLYTAASDLPELQCKTCENGTSRSVETAVQDLPKPHTSKKEIRNTENSFTEESSFIGRTRERAELQEIERRAEFQDFVAAERNLLDDCLHWLYYCSELRIGNCTYPQDYVREKLWGLTFEIAEAAVLRIQANDLEIRRNAIVYAAKVLFSCLMESRSEEMLDPVANRLKRRFST